MNTVRSFFISSIGKKIAMAITGAAITGFALAHLGGNLLAYGGQDIFNNYAAGMKKQPMLTLIWFMRVGLLAFFVVHIGIGIKLTMENSQARAHRYAVRKFRRASLPSRTMIYSGLILLAFVLFHLAHYTFFLVHPEFGNLVDSSGRHDAYAMVVAGFSSVPVSLFYMLSMILLWMHLCHGGSSLFQTLGVSHPKYRALTSYVGPIVATVLLLGNCSIPLAVLLGVIGGGH